MPYLRHVLVRIVSPCLVLVVPRCAVWQPPCPYPAAPTPAWTCFIFSTGQQLADREREVVNHVLLSGVQRWRRSLLRAGIRKFREGCLVARGHKILLQARASRLRSLAVFLRARRAPEMDIAQAFTIWSRGVSSVKVRSASSFGAFLLALPGCRTL